ncbi:MAG: guanosine monophosphate reductase [Candidatus Dormibacteraeota bacterium]|uniref:Guanosine monophosphate reductase n=1 Tax=Candidatus Amunia macphersoniae TaxID=3127014 RepID=A0A934KQJ4_9BACT|nr:guanosine monophosphate reductase [Candidatus Dormibacteraeota bacterium]
MTAAPLLRAHADPLGDLPVAFDYDHLSLVPRVSSSLTHRLDAAPTLQMGPLQMRLPLAAAPMPDVCGPEMCRALAAAGALGVLHRFQRVDEQVAEFTASHDAAPTTVGAAVGVTGDYRDRFAGLYGAGCRIVCLDTANGAHEQVGDAIRWIREQADDVFIIAGNVATAETFRWLEDRGADAIRVGIAGGSVCETRTETAVYAPTPHAVAEAAQVRRRALIIGDSGVRNPADMCKLLALGADLVMVGSALAGTREAPGRVIVVDGKKFKIMRGAASFSVQQQGGTEDPGYIEGTETLVQYKGGVDDVVRRYLGGLRSSMSYMDARTLEEYRENVSFIVLR